jgi:hypothetical protein
MIAAFLIAIGLNRSSSEITNEREDRNMSALRQAKAALISYAANEGWQDYKGQASDQPGGLPCPDTSTNNGTSPGICSNAANRVGRLPFASIGADDLKDASGERLWYAVSSNFYKKSGVGGNVINSDSQGLLTVQGSAPTNNVVAIVFAPGAPVLDSTMGAIQDRNGLNVFRIASYLENFTVGTNDYTFASIAHADSTANDRLLVITQAELMAAVEPVVAARIERDIKPVLNNYSSEWGWDSTGTTLLGAFPFPALFALTSAGPGDNSNSPSTPPKPRLPSAYQGDPSQTSGLLPITTSLSYPWTGPGLGSVTLVGGICDGKTPAQGPNCPQNLSCGTDSNTPPGWKCTFRVEDPFNNPRFQIAARIDANAGISFPKLPNTADVIGIDNDTGSPMTFSSPTIRGTLSGSGVGTVFFEATWAFSDTNHHDVSITLPGIVVSSSISTSNIPVSSASNASPIRITTSIAHGLFTGARVNISGVTGNGAANGDWTISVVDSTRFTLNGSSGTGAGSGGAVTLATAWFVANEWYRQTYYSLSPGYLPGGAGSCVSRPTPPTSAGSPSCLLVNNLSANYAPFNNKQAILILAGRALNGSNRPSSLPNDYLEDANQTAHSPVPYAYEHGAGAPTSINDRVVVIAP